MERNCINETQILSVTKIKSKLLASILPLEADLMRHCGFVTAQKYHAVLSLLNLFFQIGIANVVLWRVV